MRTITAILEPNADGTLHLPLPLHLRHGKVKVKATLESVEAGVVVRGTQTTSATATSAMIEQRKAALAQVRQLNPYREMIDPPAWQRQVRADRPMPDRK